MLTRCPRRCRPDALLQAHRAFTCAHAHTGREAQPGAPTRGEGTAGRQAAAHAAAARAVGVGVGAHREGRRRAFTLSVLGYLPFRDSNAKFIREDRALPVKVLHNPALLASPVLEQQCVSIGPRKPGRHCQLFGLVDPTGNY